jgi:hypothetical protein
MWLTNAPVPVDVCEREPLLKDYGLFRKLNDGKLEFISICNPQIKHWLSIHEIDFKDLLDKYIPEKPK